MLMDAQQLIDFLEGARIVDLRSLGGSTFIIEAERNNQRLMVTARALEILTPEAVNTPKATQHFKVRPSPRGGVSIFSQRQHWPIEVLKREGLPLYWNQDWLEQQISLHGSIQAAAKANNYSPQTVNNFAVRVFRMQRRPRLDPHLKLKAQQLKAQGLSLQQIANQLGISKASVYRSIEELG